MYPKLIIDREAFRNNARIIKKLCDDNNVSLCAVVKVYHAMPELITILHEEGINEYASSRVVHLKNIKGLYPEDKTLLIRIPMISELEEVVKYVDTTLISERDTLEKLNEVASKYNKVQDVILMEDLGDLREGIIDQNDLVSLADYIKNNLKNIHIKGIGTNLTCYGSIRPTVTNLSKLIETKHMIEDKIGEPLEIVSGGATTSVELLIDGNMPKEVNHLRVGGLFTTPEYIKEFKIWKNYLPGLRNVFTVEAEVIESNTKPTYPIGEIVVDGFGNKIEYEDRGDKKRIIVALGKCDIGGYLQLYPHDKNSFILGGSSDHTIIDVDNSDINYKVGDIVELDLDYESIMIGMESKYLNVILK